MPEQNSPLSYQTTMPEYPDVSYEAWRRNYYGDAYGTPFERFTTPIPTNRANYQNWRTNLLDKYNAQMSAYNTWLQTGEGRRASLLSGGYNASYYDGQSASASPLSYQEAPDNPGVLDMAQGLSGIFSFASALQGLKMMSSQIAGQELKNKAQAINNQYLESLLRGKVTQFGLKNDRQQFEIEQLFYPRWSKRPELWAQGVFSPYGREIYDLRDAQEGLGYQRAVADLDYLKAGKALRDSQSALAKASEREKTWYIENVMQIQKEILENQNKILSGEYDFQKTEFKLRKAGVIANIGVGTINAAVNAIKAFTPAGLLGSRDGFSGLGGRTWDEMYGGLSGSQRYAGYNSAPYMY